MFVFIQVLSLLCSVFVLSSTKGNNFSGFSSRESPRGRFLLLRFFLWKTVKASPITGLLFSKTLRTVWHYQLWSLKTQHNENCSKLNCLLALRIVAHFTGWGSFWTFSRFLGILGTPQDHPGGCGSVSRDMGGREKKRCFSDFLACIHKYIENFKKQYLSKVLFSNASNAPNRKSNISWLLGNLETHVVPI